MRQYWRQGVTVGVLGCLLLWLLTNTPALPQPLVHFGPHTESVLLTVATVMLALTWFWGGP